MALSVKYDPSQVEDKWYSYWLKHKLFHSEPDEREPYTIVIPPPNVTGVLHMGHMMNNTLQDVLVRRARMMGKNACWVPGTDHASIATEAKVVAKLKAEGINKSDITREEFLRHAWEWREKHGGIILEQLKKLGASCDWDRTKFTMDPALSKAVINTFVYFYKKGYIYRGVRMVNWDPEGLTAVSDEEVIHKETDSKFYYLRYKIVGPTRTPDGKDYIIIATTRPETIMADAAVCIHPEDTRYDYLRGQKVVIPLINKEIPIIEDDYVTMDFGTGCLKVTPAHDINDYAIGLRHKLPVLDIIDEHGHLNAKAQILIGEDRFVARKKIVKMLEEAQLLEKTEDYKSQVGYSERTNAVIEPRLSMQWFLKMEDLSKEALRVVEDDEVQLIPDKFKNTYRHWMENVHDWCISRQLWWGQQIPAYYLPDGEYVVEASKEEALAAAQKINPSLKAEDLIQDEDVLDTWFSSWLWPISVFDPDKPGFPDREPNRDLAYYYPTNDLITAPEILFFWVARMIMAGDEFCHKIPFSHVYLTGIVRDKQGRKMSKQLGNSPDPIKLMQEYGADGVRLGMLLCTSAGNDILFDESQVEQGRNFSNKIWNAYRLIQGWNVDGQLESRAEDKIAVEWFAAKLNRTLESVNDLFDKFRISDALMLIYKFFWDDFCAWYLEIIKPAFVNGVQSSIDKVTYDKTISFFDSLLKILHPFMPFITEELWHNIEERKEGETIMLEQMQKPQPYSAELIHSFDIAQQAVVSVRALRQSKNISPKEPLALQVKAAGYPQSITPIIEKMANISDVQVIDSFDKVSAGQSFMVETIEFYVPLDGKIDVGEEVEKIKAEIARYEGFLKSVSAKLSNDKFVKNAPAQVVDTERKKMSDATTKIENLQKRLEMLS
ncbi:MAG: valine--tRNA ligase [Bacteroidales bacterium]|nr:valine--tRNA ligase [Bacteroidales bacterium]MDD3201549.1 valine--tRNA ligase [Bacteroidales bacterium]